MRICTRHCKLRINSYCSREMVSHSTNNKEKGKKMSSYKIYSLFLLLHNKIAANIFFIGILARSHLALSTTLIIIKKKIALCIDENVSNNYCFNKNLEILNTPIINEAMTIVPECSFMYCALRLPADFK